MCLITSQKEPLIVTRNKIVYKFLIHDGPEECHSIYNSMYYKIGKEYKTKVMQDKDICCYDEHDRAYLDKYYNGWMSNLKKHKLISIGPGYHSMTLPRARKALNSGEEGSVYKCTIPKGTELYIGFTGLMV